VTPSLRLDHVIYGVPDLDAAMATPEIVIR
jgi:hypothetical protein